MACWTQHHFELDFALRRASWRPAEQFGYAGWQTGAKADPFNRLATYPDEICDWLWHKQPWSEAAVCLGLACARESFARGDLKAAALKFALLSHYVIDALAVSHSWLDFLGEIEDFADEASLKAFHDPVENLPADELARARPVATDETFDRIYPASVRRAYELGKETCDTFHARGAEACWPLVVAGVDSSAPVLLALAEAVLAERAPLNRALGLESGFVDAVTRGWVMRAIFEAPNAQTILDHLADPQQGIALRERLGWKGSDIFFAQEKCSSQARAMYARWREDRERWRSEQMGGVLPARPAERITADWRPKAIALHRSLRPCHLLGEETVATGPGQRFLA